MSGGCLGAKIAQSKCDKFVGPKGHTFFKLVLRSLGPQTTPDTIFAQCEHDLFCLSGLPGGVGNPKTDGDGISVCRAWVVSTS